MFVPGLVSHLELQWQQLSYRRFVTALEQACRVIRFDKRGTGLSDPTDALPSMDQRVVDLAAVMDAAGSQTAVVFGVSDGGRGAVAFAAAHPGRVLGLVLYGTSYRGPRPGLLDRYRSIVSHWGEGDLLELVAPSLADPVSRDAARGFGAGCGQPGDGGGVATESMGGADVSDLLATLQMPTLVVHREQDMIPLADARAVAKAIPGAFLRVVPGRDHLPWAGDWGASHPGAHRLHQQRRGARDRLGEGDQGLGAPDPPRGMACADRGRVAGGGAGGSGSYQR